MILTGSLSSAAANSIAVGARQDDEAAGSITHPEMLGLAAAGSSGAQPAHIWRDLQKMVGLAKNPWPQPLMLNNVPILDRKTSPPRVAYVDWPILLMQDVLHYTYTENRPEFCRRFVGSSDLAALRHYWQAFREDDPRIVQHPLRQDPDWMENALPGRIHVDGVPYGKSKLASIDVANVSSPLATGDTLDTLNLWWWVPKSLCTSLKQHGVCTRRRVWKGAVWDLLCCVKGEFLPWDWRA